MAEHDIEADIDYARRFVGMGLVAAGVSLTAGDVALAEQPQTDAASAPATTRATYLVVYRPGPSWTPGKPLSEQGLGEHFKYVLGLYRTGSLRQGGGFTDDSGGAMVIDAQDDAAARAIVAADPAVTAGIFAFDLRPWRLVPWAEVARKSKP